MSTCQIITYPNVELNIKLRNGKEEKHYLTNQSFELLDDWQLLEILHKGAQFGGKACEIKDVLINGQSVNHLFWTAWYTDENKNKIQPRNILGKNPCKWSIVLHSDISTLVERITNQIKTGDFGKNLFEKYQWFLDLAEPIPKNYTPTIKSFLERSLGLNLYPKKEYQLWPFIKLNLPPIDTNAVYNEIKSISWSYMPVSQEWSHATEYSNNEYSKSKDINSKLGNLENLKLKSLKEWIIQLGIDEATSVHPFCLQPQGEIYLHVDYNPNRPNQYYSYRYTKNLSGPGIRHIHIPITNNDHTKLKISGGGLLPNCANFINSGSYTHGGANFGNLERYIITINADWTLDFVEKYIDPVPIYCNLDI